MDPSLLDSPELGSAADTFALYDSVTRIRPTPIGKAALLSVAIPAAIPLLGLLAMEVPIKDLLIKIIQILL